MFRNIVQSAIGFFNHHRDEKQVNRPVLDRHPIGKNEMINAINLINSGTLDSTIESALIKKIFSSLNSNLLRRPRLNSNDMLDVIDILASTDHAIRLVDYPRAHKAFISYIKLNQPIVDLGINCFGEHIIDKFTLYKNPLNQKTHITWISIGSNNKCCERVDEDERQRIIKRMTPYI